MNTIITISREYGAGGHSIAKRVAQALGVEIYDRDIIRDTAKSTGLDTGVVEREEEELSRSGAFWRMITPAAYVDQHESIHEIERQVILSLAGRGPCVILGRCADAILEEANIDSLNVFIYADDIHRAVRVSELLGTKNPSEIQKAIKRTDAARRSYYQKESGRHWGDYRNYNLMLDSGALGYDACVRMICDAAKSFTE